MGKKKTPTHPYIPVHINAIQQVLLNVCPRIVLPRLRRGGGRKESPGGMRSSRRERQRERGRRTGVSAWTRCGAAVPWAGPASKGLQARSQLKGIAGPEGFFFFPANIPPKISRCDGWEGNLPRAVWVTRVKRGRQEWCLSWNSAAKQLKKGAFFFFFFSIDWE